MAEASGESIMNEHKPIILIVDDSPANIHVLTELLRDEYCLKVATDGNTALRLAGQPDKPDLILLDIMMPEMDGYEVCRRLKADGMLKDIPVIFITALTEEEHETRGLELGAVDYITKPFNQSIVKLRVKNQLELKKHRDALNRLSHTDGLTGISNRREFDEYFKREWQRAERSGKPISILMMDIDFFKRYNDHYGHAAGDACLKKVAEAIAGSLERPGDLAARYGGEEFVCVLPETDESGGVFTAERIMNAVKKMAIPHEKSDASDAVTLSIGIAAAVPQYHNNSAALLKKADEALYTAKSEGRNRIFCYGRERLESSSATKTALKQSSMTNESLLTAQRIARIGNWEWDIAENTLSWSDEIYRIFGRQPQEFEATYEEFLRSIHPDDRSFVTDSVNKALYENAPYNIVHRVIRPGGDVIFVNEQGEVFFDESNKPVKMIGTVQDVTELKKTEAELKRLARIIDEIINIVIITDDNGNIEYVNSAFERITGYSKDEAMGKNPRILASGETPPEHYKNLWNTIRLGKTWRGVFRNKKKNGDFYWANGFISPIKNEWGDITNYLAIQEDITDKMRSEERLRYLSAYDSVTGIMNRSRFVETLSDWFQPESSGKYGVLIQINIDGFKLINDTYGHSIGDQFLKNFAEFIAESAKELDLFHKPEKESMTGRLGGDEFAVFLFFRGEKEGTDFAEELRKKVERYRFLNDSIRVTVSIGIALYPSHSSTAGELLSIVNAATSRAKELGQNRCYLFRQEDTSLEKSYSSFEEKKQIISAMEEDRFVPWFQPILDLKTDEVHHYEALARLMANDGTILPPSSFIFTAERYGLISGIDRIITEKTMSIQAQLSRLGRKVSFSMNLSGRHLGDTEMLKYLQNSIKESGADPDCIVFELTETAAVGDFRSAVDFVKELKDMGCKFSLDDFGVGFTSFVHLIEMEVDFIKIDGSFVRHLPERERDRMLVTTIAEMARGLGIKTIAEFVDRQEILPILRDFGVDYAQGYLIGKPAPTLLS
jgi:diguanylate cyclase (GGDEF)-like protein/PAS domain S-box-containing protein